MDPVAWRHMAFSGPYPWEPAMDFTVEEIAPGQYAYLYRRCECLRLDPRFYRPAARRELREGE
jgi:hypothetical protein